MSSVGLFVHAHRPQAEALRSEISAWLAARGHQVTDSPLEVPVDLVVAIGGDGTMLQAAHTAVAHSADLLGVNLGQLGYLAEVEAGNWSDALEAYLDGRHRITERFLVQARIHSHDPAVADLTLDPALNEVVIEKQAMGRTVRLGVSIDGEHFTSYVADGLILATPTGSTAYSLSARGPIVDPAHRAILLTPVSPHSLFDRSLVLEPSTVVEVGVMGERRATVAVDGQQVAVLDPGDRVEITGSDVPARFVTFEGRNFHQILKAKFGLSDR